MPDSTEVKTLILRFRDLGGIKRGDTIAFHRALIEEHGYTWWGWWHKFGERAPVTVFNELATRVRADGPIKAFLLDSGAHEIRGAEIAKFELELDGSLRDSPEKNKTPEYYRDSRFLAWYKLSHIDASPSDPEIVRQYTYVDIAEFFDTAESKFRQYDGARVKSLIQLLDQNRTIWFVRDHREGDREKPLKVADETSPHRTPFSKAWVASHSNSVLLLSDLHFGHHAFPTGSSDPSPSEAPLALRLEDELKLLNKKEIAGALIAGDLSWRAEKTELEQAIEFFRSIRSWSTLEWPHFVVCPGNHDLRFSDDPAEKDVPVSVFDEKASANYANFYRELFQHDPNASLSMGKRFLLGGGQRVEVAALNSSLLQQLAPTGEGEDKQVVFQGHGFIGGSQLKSVAEGMGWPDRSEVIQRNQALQPDQRPFPRPFRIAMVHHHLVPVTYSEKPYPQHRTSVVFDAEALVRWIVDHQVDLVIHGHMHEPFLCQIARPIPGAEDEPWHSFVVLGLGSAGVADDHLWGEKRNTYGVLDFRRDGYTVILRRVDPTGEIKDESKEVFSVTIPYTEAVSQ